VKNPDCGGFGAFSAGACRNSNCRTDGSKLFCFRKNIAPEALRRHDDITLTLHFRL
jgi:hypothetical protein